MAAKKTNRLTRSRKPKAKKPKQPSFKHAVVIEIVSGKLEIRTTVPGVTFAIINHDEHPDNDNFKLDGFKSHRRIIHKADRITNGVARRYLGKGEPLEDSKPQ